MVFLDLESASPAAQRSHDRLPVFAKRPAAHVLQVVLALSTLAAASWSCRPWGQEEHAVLPA